MWEIIRNVKFPINFIFEVSLEILQNSMIELIQTQRTGSFLYTLCFFKKEWDWRLIDILLSEKTNTGPTYPQD